MKYLKKDNPTCLIQFCRVKSCMRRNYALLEMKQKKNACNVLVALTLVVFAAAAVAVACLLFRCELTRTLLHGARHLS